MKCKKMYYLDCSFENALRMLYVFKLEEENEDDSALYLAVELYYDEKENHIISSAKGSLKKLERIFYEYDLREIEEYFYDLEDIIKLGMAEKEDKDFIYATNVSTRYSRDNNINNELSDINNLLTDTINKYKNENHELREQISTIESNYSDSVHKGIFIKELIEDNTKKCKGETILVTTLYDKVIYITGIDYNEFKNIIKLLYSDNLEIGKNGEPYKFLDMKLSLMNLI